MEACIFSRIDNEGKLFSSIQLFIAPLLDKHRNRVKITQRFVTVIALSISLKYVPHLYPAYSAVAIHLSDGKITTSRNSHSTRGGVVTGLDMPAPGRAWSQVCAREKEMEKVIWYVPLSQAAEMIGCRPREVYMLIEQGKLDFIEAPKGKIKVSKESLQRYLADKHYHSGNGEI